MSRDAPNSKGARCVGGKCARDCVATGLSSEKTEATAVFVEMVSWALCLRGVQIHK